ncbi:MAG: chemotaxis protein CheA [Pseudomonadota bacterium]
MELDKYIQIFISQAEEYLQEIYSMLLKLENGHIENDLMVQLLSNTHSIKGMSRTVGFSEVEELSHKLEDFIQKVPNNKLVEKKDVDLLLEGFALLEEMMRNVKSGSSQKIEYQYFLAKLKPRSLPEETQEVVMTRVDLSPKLKEATFARVKTETLDNMLNSISELLICQNRLQTIGKGFASRELKTTLYQMNELIRELHLQITIARMMPIKMLTDRVARTLRGLTGEAGKEIDFKVVGEDMEMDRAIIEGLEEPLLHIIRNAVDHGIESLKERENKGKSPRGTITLKISRTKENSIIQVEDDGKGMNPDLIKQRMVKTGLIRSEEAGNISPEDALMLICAPGFSTAEKVTETSGRGVGMNIVKNKIEALGGNIAIFSRPGEGSRFVLKLPLALTVMPAFIVRSGLHCFAIPIAKVVSNARISPEQISVQDQKESFLFRNTHIPLYCLTTLLKIDSSLSLKEELSVVVTEIGNRQVGLVVDEFLGQQEVVIKPLKPPLNHMKIFSGVTLLGTGEITLILNLEEIDLH